MRNRIVVFGGTTEGRTLVEELNNRAVDSVYCVATEYGEMLVDQLAHVEVVTGRMDESEMVAFLQNETFQMVIDATHPYAVEVTKNIQNAAAQTKLSYRRLLRTEDRDVAYNQTYWVDSVKEAAQVAETINGTIFVTTGSKELEHIVKNITNLSRLMVRILPSASVLEACMKLGLKMSQLIAMQGPFSTELNVAMLKQTGAKCLITKDGGAQGGYPEKVEAAKRLGIPLIVIRRPEEVGITKEQLFVELFPQEKLRQLSIVGIGMGAYENQTIEVSATIEKADLLIGASRMLESVNTKDKVTFREYRAEEIEQYLVEHPEYRQVAILLSGDSGFYSAAEKLKQKFPQAKILPGISSVSYFASKLGVSYQGAKLLSMHGRDLAIVNYVKNSEETRFFVLVSGKKDVMEIARLLIEYGMSTLQMGVGVNLSYGEEWIKCGTAKDFLTFDMDGTCIVYLEKCVETKKPALFGLSDAEFIRDKVPMTKEEIRTISLSKLQLSTDSVVYDIGAGTGSVSVECARICKNGTVYAIEKKEMALELIEANKIKHGVDNLKIIAGIAPQILTDLEVPTHAFIGGSSGNLEEIVDCLLEKNPNVRVVITAISLETIAELQKLLESDKFGYKQLIQVMISKEKEIGSYHLMEAQNPIWIGVFQNGLMN